MTDPSGASTRPLEPADIASLRPRLLALVRKVSPRWLADQAEDIVQTAIVSVLEHLRAAGGNSAVSSSYLMRAAHNAAVDEIRRRFRRPEIGAGDDMEIQELRSDAPGPGEEAEAREIDRALRACLAGLARPRRAAVTLFLLGYSLAETEQLSGWSRKRAEHLTYRGLAAVRQCLSQKGIAP
jgi:RNA polymerase sigma-70 factor (ECF subfamily)